MSTEKLYYNDGYLKDFTANVITCENNGSEIFVVLDKTAFFPEGGGQKADTGYIGNVKVTDVQEENGVIKHFVESDVPLGEYFCKIDWDFRFSRMQNHTGEHIVSGVVHGIFGYDNVGFHMEEEYVTVDFNGELTREQLDEVEEKANAAVYENIAIQCLYPEASELEKIDYRSKLELTEEVRLVKIGDVDLCACCAPHVNKTGEVGTIKILDFMRHRGGVRIVMRCGFTALKDYREKYASVYAVSGLLSAKQPDIAKAVERLKNENDVLKREMYSFKQSIADADKNNLIIKNGISYFVSSFYDADMMRTLANHGMTISFLCVILSGNDEEGYSYIAGSNTADMRTFAKIFNTALLGRGGGRDTMIQGKISSPRREITNFINNFDISTIQGKL